MSVRILVGDVRQRLTSLADGSVRCCVTSPPYFGLRDYGTASWVGGDATCNHRKGQAQDRDITSGLAGTTTTQNHSQEPSLDQSGNCAKCGAIRQDVQIGLEPTPAAYVAELVAVFREVRRVLTDDGTLWLNLGDSYAAGRGGTPMPAETLAGGTGGIGPDEARRGRPNAQVPNTKNPNATIAKYQPHRDAGAIGLKHKDLIGIPWRVAFALQADGWYLRSDIIWHKPNPMPESVTDRPTKSHEYLFLLAKSERYYYDAAAIAEPAEWARWGDQAESKKHTGTAGHLGGKTKAEIMEIAKKSSRKQDNTGNPTYTGFNERYALVEPSLTRNKRTVWTVPTMPFKGAHFATFPPALIEPCILAGSAKGDAVLDPFGGAGTTGLVADRLGRSAILCELNPAYATMAEQRIRNDNPMFTEVVTESAR